MLQAQQASNEAVDFVQDVKPILAKHCYACHGPDESEGGLNLSTKRTAFAETDSGSHAIVPSDPAASEILVRVTSNDEFDQMPPEGERLTPSQVEILRQWIQQGATWDEHWAFKPMQVIPVPEVNDQEWAKHPIDAFIYSSLDSAGLRPNPPAKRQDLLRRAFYDLTLSLIHI